MPFNGVKFSILSFGDIFIKIYSWVFIHRLWVHEVSGTLCISGLPHTEESTRLVVVNSTPLAVHAIRRKWVINAPSARVRSGHCRSTGFMRPSAIRVLAVKVIVLTPTIDGHESFIITLGTHVVESFQGPRDDVPGIVCNHPLLNGLAGNSIFVTRTHRIQSGLWLPGTTILSQVIEKIRITVVCGLDHIVSGPRLSSVFWFITRSREKSLPH